LCMLGLSGLVINTYMPEYGTESYQSCKENLDLNSYMVKKDLPFVTERILEIIEGDQEVFSHFYYPGGGNYDYQILLQLITVLPFSTALPLFKDAHFCLSDRRTIDVFLEFYPFIESSLRFDEYQNIRYEKEKFYEGVSSYLGYLHETYNIQTDKMSVDRNELYKLLAMLSEHSMIKERNVKKGNH